MDENLMIDPNKEEFKYSIKFNFSVTNNISKYEALLSGLKLTKKIRVGRIIVYKDS